MLDGLRSLLPRVRALRNLVSPSGEAISKIPLVDMLAHNWYLGFTSFGGPTVHFQIFRRLFVEEYHWIDEPTYQEMFALCQALSGPGSTKMMYAINVMRYGFWTGLAAFFVWSLPMAIAAFGLSLGVARIGKELPGPAYALLSGLNSATVGIIALAAYQLSAKAITDKISRILVFLGAAAGMLYNALWYFPIIMLVGGLATIIHDLRLLQRSWRRLRRDKNRVTEDTAAAGEVGLRPVQADESEGRPRARGAALDPPSTTATASGREEDYVAPASRTRLTGSWKTGVSIIAAFLVVFVVVMALRASIGGEDRGFDVFANFFLAGTIIFGGGPVVVPLLRAYIVTPGWVSSRDFLLGLAITQAFPGPNFNFAVYLGALAVAGSDIPPAVGAIIGFVAIFTPGKSDR